MTEPDWDRVNNLFLQARSLDVSGRAALLDEHCGSDAALRVEVESLLAHHDGPGGVLDVSPVEVLPAAREAINTPPMVGQRVGQYEVQELIGAGGMSMVYLAQQDDPKRPVALKFMRSTAVSRTALRRFRHEAQILGRLRHPHIAQVYEAGTHDYGHGGVPYFAMEFVPEAATITDYSERSGLSITQRLDLFIKICAAVHHGHQRGVIHRDLKPGNILVDPSGEPKIIDFGVARCTDSDLAVTTACTDMGQIIGTLQYMSPEQCAADPENLDTRSDVYALGAVLFELLCGRAPHDLAGLPIHEAARIIREEPATRLSSLDRALRGDLETIVVKAMQTDRDRRYGSAAALADDLGRYVRDEPIEARPPSTIYTVRKFAHRHRVLCASIAVVFVVLLAGVMMSSYLAVKERAAHQETEKLLRTIRLFAAQRYPNKQAAIMIERIPARTDQPSVYSALMLLPDPGPTGVGKVDVLYQVDRSGQPHRWTPEVEIPAAVGVAYRMLNPFQTSAALMADVFPERGGKELVVAMNHGSVDPSVLRIYDPTDLTDEGILAEWWNFGHLIDMFWSEEDGQLIVLCHANTIRSFVPELWAYQHLRVRHNLGQRVVVALRPELNCRRVLFPLLGDDQYALANDHRIIARRPDLGDEDTSETAWRVEVEAVRPACVEGALCGIMLRYTRGDPSGSQPQTETFWGDVDSEGNIRNPFRHALDRGPADSLEEMLGVSSPAFSALEPRRIEHLATVCRAVEQKCAQAISPSEIVDDLLSLKQLEEIPHETLRAIAARVFLFSVNRETRQLVLAPGAGETAYKRALARMTEAVKIADGDGYLLATLGLAQYRAGRWLDARETMTSVHVLRRHGCDIALAVLAMSHWQLGDRDKAIAALGALDQVASSKSGTERDRAEMLLKEAIGVIGYNPREVPAGADE